MYRVPPLDGNCRDDAKFTLSVLPSKEGIEAASLGSLKKLTWIARAEPLPVTVKVRDGDVLPTAILPKSWSELGVIVMDWAKLSVGKSNTSSRSN
jgi:hypothetical protein